MTFFIKLLEGLGRQGIEGYAIDRSTEYNRCGIICVSIIFFDRERDVKPKPTHKHFANSITPATSHPYIIIFIGSR